MRHTVKFALFGMLWLVAGGAAAADNQVEALIASGPRATDMPLPDPTHVPLRFGKDIKWQGLAGEKQALLFGDPNKPGIYGILIKWEPGHYSKPHFHSTDRYIYVVSGTWWVSASDHWDPDKTYPVPAGSYVHDIANTVHWDGAKDEACLLMLVGTGPMVTTRAGEPDKKP
jgi:quercetin dioxygenase-like cupin family protein